MLLCINSTHFQYQQLILLIDNLLHDLYKKAAFDEIFHNTNK